VVLPPTFLWGQKQKGPGISKRGQQILPKKGVPQFFQPQRKNLGIRIDLKKGLSLWLTPGKI